MGFHMPLQALRQGADKFAIRNWTFELLWFLKNFNDRGRVIERKNQNEIKPHPCVRSESAIEIQSEWIENESPMSIGG